MPKRIVVGLWLLLLLLWLAMIVIDRIIIVNNFVCVVKSFVVNAFSSRLKLWREWSHRGLSIHMYVVHIFDRLKHMSGVVIGVEECVLLRVERVVSVRLG